MLGICPTSGSSRLLDVNPVLAYGWSLFEGGVSCHEKAHTAVWPELLAKLKEVGISDYSIFRRGQDLFLVMRVRDFDAAWDALAKDPVNQRWQAEMTLPASFP